MMSRRRCPQCAERVRTEAVVCRYCRAQLPTASADQGFKFRRAEALGGIAAAIACVALVVAYLTFRDLKDNRRSDAHASPESKSFVAPAAVEQASKYPLLAVG